MHVTCANMHAISCSVQDNMQVGACTMHEFGTFCMHVACMHYECPAQHMHMQLIIMAGITFTRLYNSMYISLHVYSMSQNAFCLNWLLHACYMDATCLRHACCLILQITCV